MQDKETPKKKKGLLQTGLDLVMASSGNPPPLNVDAFLAELLQLKVEELGINLSEIIFQGFQPRLFLQSVAKRAASFKVSDAAHKKNMIYLGVLCAARGSKAFKIVNSNGTSESAKAKIAKLINIYDIRDGKPDSPTTATLPRFLAVTVLPVSRLIHLDAGQNIRLPITPDEVAPGFPLIFCMSHAGGMMPSSLHTPEDYYKAVAYGQYLMSLKFNANPTKTQVLQFVKIAARSNLWTDEVKATHLVELGLHTGNGFTEEVSNALAIAARKFDQLPY